MGFQHYCQYNRELIGSHTRLYSTDDYESVILSDINWIEESILIDESEI